MNLFWWLNLLLPKSWVTFSCTPNWTFHFEKNNLRRSVVACDRPPFLYPYASAQAKHWSPANKPITNITPIRKWKRQAITSFFPRAFCLDSDDAFHFVDFDFSIPDRSLEHGSFQAETKQARMTCRLNKTGYLNVRFVRLPRPETPSFGAFTQHSLSKKFRGKDCARFE